ncbi:hypothetical protein LTR36_004871 [Oleoguttula mirabilis]|uniref:Uncharacterized protein n=1 Tax=Oleoguttula mirabilis TaxID=1507867 RepID=A0AAV9JG03_9PEZI|nr:hypothetical protein LTR36_004871 [Oleoguttula mirabilis]
MGGSGAVASLSRVSHQVRDDARPIFFATAVFELQVINYEEHSGPRIPVFETTLKCMRNIVIKQQLSHQSAIWDLNKLFPHGRLLDHMVEGWRRPLWRGPYFPKLRVTISFKKVNGKEECTMSATYTCSDHRPEDDPKRTKRLQEEVGEVLVDEDLLGGGLDMGRLKRALERMRARSDWHEKD